MQQEIEYLRRQVAYLQRKATAYEEFAKATVGQTTAGQIFNEPPPSRPKGVAETPIDPIVPTKKRGVLIKSGLLKGGRIELSGEPTSGVRVYAPGDPEYKKVKRGKSTPVPKVQLKRVRAKR